MLPVLGRKPGGRGREGEAGRSRLKGQEIACLIHIPDLQDPGLDRRPEPVGKAVDLEPDVGDLGLLHEPGADQLVCVERPVKRRDEHIDRDGLPDDLAHNRHWHVVEMHSAEPDAQAGSNVGCHEI